MVTTRSVLFVPGPDPDRIEDAVESDADLVILDLEHSADTFASGADGRRVRTAVERWRNEPHRIGVRIHRLDTKRGFADVAAIADADVVPDVVCIPDVEYAHQLSPAAAVLAEAGADLFPLIESPRGVFEARSIVSTVPSVTMVGFGPSDFRDRMGTSDVADPDLTVPRHLVVMAASAGGVAAIDMPSFQAGDEETRADAVAARAMGYDGKIAISRSGVHIANDVFSD